MKRLSDFQPCAADGDRTLLSGTALAAGQHPFTDVPQSHWANEAVGYVYENDLMNGVSATMFQPWPAV